MKKASIITIHVGFNFGSVLQTVATAVVLQELGYNPTIVNYIPDRVTYRRYFKEGLKDIRKLIRRVLYFPFHLKNVAAYNGFLATHTNLSQPIYAGDDFAAKCPVADVYVTGSDQVWNSIHNEGFDGHYFFDDIAGANKIAFASSIGREKIDDEELHLIKERLSKYKAVSVRESSAVKILNSIGIDSTLVLDPTLLLDKDQWLKIAGERIEKSPYLLIYTPYNIVDEELIYRAARKMADKHGLKIVTFSWTHQKNRFANYTYRYARPEEFLSLMYFADFVITNSFHGTAFSINLNKQFVVYQPSAFSTRIMSLIEIVGLRSRLVSDDTDITALPEINYSQVNKLLDAERGKSMDFLRKALG